MPRKIAKDRTVFLTERDEMLVMLTLKLIPLLTPAASRMIGEGIKDRAKLAALIDYLNRHEPLSIPIGLIGDSELLTEQTPRKAKKTV
jgi:hypothetical protein